MDNQSYYDQISTHPSFTQFQRRAWTGLDLIVEAGIFTQEKADFIREQYLTIAWDVTKSQHIDLINPSSPRDFVVTGNRDRTTLMGIQLESVREATKQPDTNLLNQDLKKQPWAKEIRHLFGYWPELENVELVILDPEKSKIDLGNYWIFDGFHKVVVFTPKMYAKKSYFAGLYNITPFLGFSEDVLLGWPLISACLEIVSRDGYGDIGVASWIDEAADISDTDPVPLAKDLILGNPEPLFTFLDRYFTPLGTALFLYISDDAEDTEATIERLAVILKLRELAGVTHLVGKH